MFNSELFFMLVSAVALSGLIFIYISNIHYKKEISALSKKLKIIKDDEFKEVDFKYASTALVFMDSLIELKFSYHLYSTLMPIYMEKKIPEKSQIDDIKEKIYVSVVGGLSRSTKKSILNFFTEKGIEIYIHEKIVNLMNRTDVINSDKYNDSFKDAKGDKLDTLMP